MGLADDETVLIKLAALHDVGKVGIRRYPSKEGPLDQTEWEIMKTHTTIGEKMLSSSSHPVISGAEVAIGHHEKWDGSGYPHGKRGTEVALSARIVAMADVYDALRSNARIRLLGPTKKRLQSFLRVTAERCPVISTQMYSPHSSAVPST